ncbi:hypothetical protein BKA59DRAFT_559887 [Fusarium tricinctum]|uniref:Uncharacterized protein n=1 Tax=Fusarium tricinctum TaxID=61284 RepID=A0A8K0RMM8_9HYPO|nr:hypothetical protein BKA59DRAFT_559887 [Fusarium tricinctum]
MAQLQCSVCCAEFAKSDHLARHQLSHGNERAYMCEFCPLSFNRRDALLRHWRTCKRRIESGLRPLVLPPKKRGRKLNACSRCSQLKKKCSGTTPCAACVDRGQQCTYPRSFEEKTAPLIEREQQSLAPPFLCIPHNLNTQVVQLPHFSLPDIELFPVNLADGIVANCWPSDGNMPDHSLDRSQDGLFPFSLLGEDKALDVSPLNFVHCPPTYSHELNSLVSGSICQPLAIDSSFLRLDMRFLANVTSTHGMANSFEIGNSLARKRAISNLVQGYNIPVITRPYGRAQQARVETSHSDYDVNSSGFLGRSASRDAGHSLSSKSQEIVRGLRESLSNGASVLTNNANSSQSTERSCARFFSPANLERFISLFWHFWYPNWPVFHQPTFDITQKPAQLIAALSLIGACVSPEKIDRDRAISWLEVVEDWVFSDPEFSEDVIPQIYDESMLSQVETRLDSIRAAYALMIVMTWEGDSKHMTRSRRTRFTETVCVSRSLYFFCALQSSALDGSTYSGHSRWRLYSLREECIRSLVYVFMLDCAFVMFNNTAPRMVVGELQFGLTSPEDWFHATTSSDWLECVRNSPRIDQGISLCDAINKIMQGVLDATDCKIFEQTSLLNHFAIISAFHNLIYLHNYGLDGGSQSPHLLRGLKNWIQVWHARVLSMVNDETLNHGHPGRIGFYRHTREYWCLAVILYSQFQKGQSLGVSSNTGVRADETNLTRTIDNSDMGQLHELIIRFREMDMREVLD